MELEMLPSEQDGNCKVTQNKNNIKFKILQADDFNLVTLITCLIYILSRYTFIFAPVFLYLPHIFQLVQCCLFSRHDK